MKPMEEVTPQPIEELQSPQLPEKKTPFRYLLLIVGLLLVGLSGVIFVFYLKPSEGQNTSRETRTILPDTKPTSQELPFREMTIPYLREREYNSALGKRELVSDNSTYSSYLTSYLSDGLRVNAQLTIPTREKPNKGWPAIVFIHGYIPPAQYVTTEKYVDYVDYLARNGFVVLKIDLRGHGQSEGEAGGGYYSSDYVVDTLNAYVALQQADFVNPEAVGLWGHSMAGNIVLRSMAARPSIPASVIWAGAVYSYTDMRKYGIQDSSYRPPETSTSTQNRRRELFEKVGSPSAQSEFWQQVAPINYVKDLQGAIEIHHARNDDVVDIGYSRDLNAALDKTTVPHQLYEYESGGHNIDGGSFVVAMQRTVDFFRKYLSSQE